LGRLVTVARQVLDATADNETLSDARQLLKQIIDQNIDVDPDDGAGPGIRRGVARDRVVSVVDPDIVMAARAHRNGSTATRRM
jgi:hypothetical protein